MQIHVGANYLEICAPKDVEVSSPEVYGSFSEKLARKNMEFEKRGGGNHPLGSSRVNSH